MERVAAMSFSALHSNDFPGIARAEAQRRIRAAGANRALSAEQRRIDAAEWMAIVEWCDYWAAAPRPGFLPGEGLDEADHLANVTLRTARAALRKWHADTPPAERAPGEAQSRAYLLFNLALRFAAFAGHPTPRIDAEGEIFFPNANPERTAA